ncbi:Polyamine aminopropyltransferase [subsurface metagenome]
MVALGSWGLGKSAEKLSPKPSAFAWTVVLYAFILLSQLLLARIVNTIMGISPGEIAGLPSIFSACLLVLTPLCLLHGFQFPFACRILAKQLGTLPIQVGRIYIAEALGSMAGGALFTYFLVHYFNHLAIAAFIVLLNLAAGFFLLRPLLSLRFIFPKLLILALCLSGVISLSSGFLDKLDSVSSQWQWKGHELLSSQNSVYQNIAVTVGEEQLNFFGGGVLLFTSPVPDIKFVEEISHFPLFHHPSPQKVLLIGGGVGGVLEEIAKHPIVEVFYVESDPLIIEIAEEYLPPSPLEDFRLKIEYTNGRLFVERTKSRFDVVIMNLPPPSTLQVNRFYTQEFFEEVRDILSHEGIFAFSLPSSEAYMSEEMIRLNRGIFRTLQEVFPAVSVIPDDPTIFLASPDTTLLPQNAEEICRRFEERGLETKLFTPPYIEYKFSSERVSRLTAYLQGPAEINHDSRPIGTFYNLALWNAMFHPKLKGIFDFASKIELWWFLPFLPLFFLPIVVSLRQKVFPLSSVSLTLLTTGFDGMTLSITLLFAFQISCGYLYQKIGILIAAFMLGLALGGWGMNRVMGRLKDDALALSWIELAVAAYVFSLPCLIFVLGESSFPIPGEVPFSFLNLLVGFLTGLEFTLASKIYLQKDGRVAGTVGSLYAIDLMGSILGALFAAVLFIPLLGLINTCLVAGMFNLTTFICLLTAQKFYPYTREMG